MIVRNFGRTAASAKRDCPAGGSWEQWCNCVFDTDGALAEKCKSQPMGPFTLPPWTNVGAIQRGIPDPTLDQLATDIGNTAGALLPGVISIITGRPMPGTYPPGGQQQQAQSSDLVLGVPKLVLVGGAGLLVLALILTRK